jgi:hypothetical protein
MSLQPCRTAHILIGSPGGGRAGKFALRVLPGCEIHDRRGILSHRRQDALRGEPISNAIVRPRKGRLSNIIFARIAAPGSAVG